MPVDRRGRFTWKRTRPASSCAAGSIRTLSRKRGRVLVRVCCPKGPKHWAGKSCRVGMVTQAIGRRP
jgi:hypothetical protein